jgi:hypothetical protein
MWKCAGCGETADDQFEVCWKCRQPRPTPETPAVGVPQRPVDEPAREYGFVRSASSWIKTLLGIFMLAVALVAGYSVFADLFRAAPRPR